MDPVHFPCITRIWVQVETLLVFCTAEVCDHVSFGIIHPGCVPTLPAQVFHRDGWSMNQLDPDLLPFIPRLWVQVETLLVCFTAEVSDHISFDHFHLGCVATLPAYVVLWIGGGTLCPALWRCRRASQLSDASTHRSGWTGSDSISFYQDCGPGLSAEQSTLVNEQSLVFKILWASQFRFVSASMSQRMSRVTYEWVVIWWTDRLPRL